MTKKPSSRTSSNRLDSNYDSTAQTRYKPRWRWQQLWPLRFTEVVGLPAKIGPLPTYFSIVFIRFDKVVLKPSNC